MDPARSRAGEAFLRELAKDPKALAKWAARREAAALAAKAVAEVMGPVEAARAAAIKAVSDALAQEHRDLQARIDAAVAECVAEFRAIEARLDREWQDQTGETRPTTIEEWTTLARRVGLPTEHIVAGDWTIQDVDAIAVGYFQSLRDARVFAAATAAPPSDDTWTVEKAAEIYARHAELKLSTARSRIVRACEGGAIVHRREGRSVLVDVGSLSKFIILSEIADEGADAG